MARPVAVHLATEPLALESLGGGFGRRDRFRREQGVLQRGQLLQLALVVEHEVEHLRAEALALARVFRPRHHREVRVRPRHRLLQRAVGAQPQVEAAAGEMARAVPGRGRGHAGDLGGPARPQVHVVQGLGAMDDPILFREVHDQAIGLQPVAALGHLDPAQELQQPFLLGRLRARGLDQGGRVVFVLDLQVDVLQQLEVAGLAVVGESASRCRRSFRLNSTWVSLLTALWSPDR